MLSCILHFTGKYAVNLYLLNLILMEDTTISPTFLQEGMAYVERNFASESSYLSEAKKIIKERFDLRDKHIIDFGCGMGSMSFWIAREKNCYIDGFDIDPNHIAVCKALQKKYPSPRISFDIRNIIEDPIDRQYDMVLLTDVVEHIKLEWLPDIFRILITRNLKPGGVLFICYPPWEGPYASHMKTTVRIPWIQLLPQPLVVGIMRKYNKPNIGKGDMLQDYLELNHINHSRLMKLLSPFKLEPILRVSHTKINNLSLFKRTNLNFFPFKYLVSHEIIAFRKPG